MSIEGRVSKETALPRQWKVPHVKRASGELKRIKEIITVHTDYCGEHPSTFVPHAIYLPVNKLTRKTAVIPWYLRCSTRLTLWISKLDKIICTVFPIRNKNCVWWLTGAKKWTIRDPQIRIFRAALPVTATNLANQQGNHDIVQLPNSNFHGCFFFLLFFLKNIRLPMFFPLKDWGFPVREP